MSNYSLFSSVHFNKAITMLIIHICLYLISRFMLSLCFYSSFQFAVLLWYITVSNENVWNIMNYDIHVDVWPNCLKCIFMSTYKIHSFWPGDFSIIYIFFTFGQAMCFLFQHSRNKSPWNITDSTEHLVNNCLNEFCLVIFAYKCQHWMPLSLLKSSRYVRSPKPQLASS